MGEVYRAKDPRLGREVAIKVLPASFSQDADRLRRFEQEAKAAGVLNHPNITAVYDIGIARRRALRRPGAARGRDAALGARRRTARAAQGDRLRHPDRPRPRRRAREGDRPPGPEAREPLRHEGRPRQDPRLRPRQADAVNEGSGPQTNLPTATPAPSPASSWARSATCRPSRCVAGPPTRAADIFSFGAILYEMLSGKSAFHGDSAADTMSAILKEDPPDLSVTNQSVSPGLERIVRHCLEKNPEQRFHSAHDLAFDLEALSGTSAQTAGAIGRAARRPAPRSEALARRPRAVRSPRRSPPATSSGNARSPLPSDLPAAHLPPRQHRQRALCAGRPERRLRRVLGRATARDLHDAPREARDRRRSAYKNADLSRVSSSGELAISLRERVPLGTARASARSRRCRSAAARRARSPSSWSGRTGRPTASSSRSSASSRTQPARAAARQGPLQSPRTTPSRPRFSPKGDRVAFLETRERGTLARGDRIWPERAGRGVAEESWAGISLAGPLRETRSGSTTAASTGESILGAVDLSGGRAHLASAPGRADTPRHRPRRPRAPRARYRPGAGILGLAPGESRERELSWFDGSNRSACPPTASVLLLMRDRGRRGTRGALLPSQDRRLACRQARRGRSASISPPTASGSSCARPTRRTGLDPVAHRARRAVKLHRPRASSPSATPRSSRRASACCSSRERAGQGSGGLYLQDIPAGKPRAIAPKATASSATRSPPTASGSSAYGDRLERRSRPDPRPAARRRPFRTPPRST